MIRSGTERKMRRAGGGKRWSDYSGMFGWSSIIQREMSDVFMRCYTAPLYSRREMMKRDADSRTPEGGIFGFLPSIYKFSPAEPREQSAPRSSIRETSAEVAGARAGTAGDEERKGLEGPSSAVGEPF